jgi:hypothetical protein
MPLHAYRLAYPDSPQTPERLWEWDKVSIARLFWNATACGRALTHRYFLTWDALAEENQRIWETSYLPCPRYESWAAWQAWLDGARSQGARRGSHPSLIQERSGCWPWKKRVMASTSTV